MGNTKELSAEVITKVQSGVRTIRAIVTSGNVDRDGDIVDVKSLRLPLRDGGYVLGKDLNGTQKLDLPLLLNHSFDVEDMLGAWQSGEYRPEQNDIVLEAKMSTREKAQDLLKLFDEDLIGNNFSITMSDYTYDQPYIYDAEVIECSLVFKGSNKDAKLLMVKSLLKGEDMADAKKSERIAELKKELNELEAATDEVQADEQAEGEVQDAPAEPTPTEEVAAIEEAEVAEVEAPAEAEVEAEDEAEEVETKSINKEDTKMTKDIAVKQVKDAPDAEVVETSKGLKVFSANEQREMFVKAFIGKATNNTKMLDEVKAKIMGNSVAGDVDVSEIFKSEVVANELRQAYTNYGNVGSLVNKIDIMGAHQWKALRLIDGEGFKPVGLGGSKPEDDLDFASAPVVPHEHALIVAWYDAIADQTPLAVYNEVIKYIAKMYAQLEDNIVLAFAGGTFNGETFEATGLQPVLTTAGRVETWDGATATLGTSLGEAIASIEADGEIAIVTNRSDWARVATLTDTLGRPLFDSVGERVTVGALGSYRVVLSDAVEAGNMVVGVFSDYDLVTRGSLETLVSREASLSTVNLYTDDATAVRAKVHISGAPAQVESFVLVDNTTVS